MENHEEQTEHIAAEGKGFLENPNQINNLFPEASVIDETSNKQLKQEHKNLEMLSMLLKNITSKKEERVQVLNP